MNAHQRRRCARESIVPTQEIERLRDQVQSQQVEIGDLTKRLRAAQIERHEAVIVERRKFEAEREVADADAQCIRDARLRLGAGLDELLLDAADRVRFDAAAAAARFDAALSAAHGACMEQVEARSAAEAALDDALRQRDDVVAANADLRRRALRAEDAIGPFRQLAMVVRRQLGMPVGASDLHVVGALHTVNTVDPRAVAKLVGWVDARGREPVAVGDRPSWLAAGAAPADVLGNEWWIGPVGWLLDDVRALAEPVAAKGFQKVWTLDAETTAQVLAQIERRVA